MLSTSTWTRSATEWKSEGSFRSLAIVLIVQARFLLDLTAQEGISLIGFEYILKIKISDFTVFSNVLIITYEPCNTPFREFLFPYVISTYKIT